MLSLSVAVIAQAADIPKSDFEFGGSAKKVWVDPGIDLVFEGKPVCSRPRFGSTPLQV